MIDCIDDYEYETKDDLCPCCHLYYCECGYDMLCRHCWGDGCKHCLEEDEDA